MILDGKALSQKIENELIAKVTGLNKSVTLAVVIVGDDPVSVKYINRKKAVGERVGVDVQLFEYEADITEADLTLEVSKLVARADIDGILVQLPLPDHINREKIINLIPPAKDPDSLGEDAKVPSPVVRAVQEILKFGQIELEGKKVVVVGQGKLVGKPVALWLASNGYDGTVVDSKVVDVGAITRHADILILGAGQPGLIKPDMIKEGVVIIDAATSEASGRLAGDADPACADKSALFTPVPGGVGPLTLVLLFANLLDLVEQQ